MTAPALPSRTRAHVALPVQRATVATGRVPPAEREHLAATLGALLRTERLAAGYGTRRFAAAVGCARSTVIRLESGRMRPRRVTLRCIAAALHPDDPLPLGDRLIAAAGASLRPDTDGAIRHRHRRANAAILSGRRPLPADLARLLSLHRQADAARRRADALLDAPGALDDPGVLGQALDQLATARQLREQAGPPITIRLGKHTITDAFGREQTKRAFGCPVETAGQDAGTGASDRSEAKGPPVDYPALLARLRGFERDRKRQEREAGIRAGRLKPRTQVECLLFATDLLGERDSR